MQKVAREAETLTGADPVTHSPAPNPPTKQQADQRPDPSYNRGAFRGRNSKG